MIKKLLLAGVLAASAFGAQITLDISGAVNGTLDSDFGVGVFPEGTVTNSGITFNIAPNTGLNYWHSLHDPASNPRSFAVPVSLSSVTHLFALVNTSGGVSGGPALARMTVIYSDFTFDTLDLVGDDDIRNFNVGSSYTNTINGNTPALGSGNKGTIDWYNNGTERLDALVYALPASALGKTVSLVLFEDNGDDLTQRMFVAGVTAQTQDVPTPEPATFGLVIGSGLVMIGLRKRG